MFATDTKPFRLDLAKELGADEVCNAAETDVETFIKDRTKGKGVDVVLEMSGAPTAIRQAMAIARPGGRVSGARKRVSGAGCVSVRGRVRVSGGACVSAVRAPGVSGVSVAGGRVEP